MDSNFPQDMLNNWDKKEQDKQEEEDEVCSEFNGQNRGKDQADEHQERDQPTYELVRKE